jgi:NAD(P)-dependent dehydrogenase (short-subunit alcohol dehydrogenase family)
VELKSAGIVITGAASGIGRAMAMRFAADGARVVVADRDGAGARRVAGECGALAVTCDVTVETQVRALVARATEHLEGIDLFCSNAGVSFGEPGSAVSASNAQWQTSWELHVMAHVYAARAVLPDMIARGGGYLLQTASAAGLLSQIGDAAYSTTKHATIGLAESLAITHGDDGIVVSVVCPQYVATPMLGYADGEGADAGVHILSPEQVADAVATGIADERFLILPHAEVAAYRQRKAADYERWLGGMRKLRRRILAETGSTDLTSMHRLI